jgi:hypothetical protein
MKIALLLRGFHYIEKDRFGFPLDGRGLGGAAALSRGAARARE